MKNPSRLSPSAATPPCGVPAFRDPLAAFGHGAMQLREQIEALGGRVTPLGGELLCEYPADVAPAAEVLIDAWEASHRDV